MAETAIWEAQFCKDDVTRPGTFYMDPFAAQHGIIAELHFSRPLGFWNSNGSVACRLGIYDDLSSPDYHRCQWFGSKWILRCSLLRARCGQTASCTRRDATEATLR